jgi:hypothetical protein
MSIPSSLSSNALVQGSGGIAEQDVHQRRKVITSKESVTLAGTQERTTESSPCLSFFHRLVKVTLALLLPALGELAGAVYMQRPAGLQVFLVQICKLLSDRQIAIYKEFAIGLDGRTGCRRRNCW